MKEQYSLSLCIDLSELGRLMLFHWCVLFTLRNKFRISGIGRRSRYTLLYCKRRENALVEVLDPAATIAAPSTGGEFFPCGGAGVGPQNNNLYAFPVDQ